MGKDNYLGALSHVGKAYRRVGGISTESPSDTKRKSTELTQSLHSLSNSK